MVPSGLRVQQAQLARWDLLGPLVQQVLMVPSGLRVQQAQLARWDLLGPLVQQVPLVQQDLLALLVRRDQLEPLVLQGLRDRRVLRASLAQWALSTIQRAVAGAIILLRLGRTLPIQILMLPSGQTGLLLFTFQQNWELITMAATTLARWV